MIEAFKGIWIGNAPVRESEIENICHLGHEWEMAIISQVVLVSGLLAQIDLYRPLSNYARLPFYALPCLAGGRLMYTSYTGGKEVKENPPLVDRIAYHAHMKFNLAIRAATFLAAITSFQTHTVRSTAIITTSTIANLMAWKGLHTKVDPNGKSAEIIEDAQKLLLAAEIVGAFCQGGPMNYLDYGYLSILAVHNFFKKPLVAPEAPTIDSLQDIAMDNREASDFAPDMSNLMCGVHATPLPRLEGVNIDRLQEIAFDLINVDENKELICESIKTNRRFTEDETYSKQDPVQFYCDGITAYVSQVKAKVHANSELLLTYALLITERAEQGLSDSDSASLRSLLVDLSIAAHQCETAWINESKDLVNAHPVKGLSIEEKLLTAMAIQREHLFRQICHEVRGSSKVARIVDTGRGHTFNSVVIGRGWELGFESYQVAQLDRTIPHKELQGLVWKMGTVIENRKFLKKYDTDWILDQMNGILSQCHLFGIEKEELRLWLEEKFEADQEHLMPTGYYSDKTLLALSWKLGLIREKNQ